MEDILLNGDRSCRHQSCCIQQARCAPEFAVVNVSSLISITTNTTGEPVFSGELRVFQSQADINGPVGASTRNPSAIAGHRLCISFICK